MGAVVRGQGDGWAQFWRSVGCPLASCRAGPLPAVRSTALHASHPTPPHPPYLLCNPPTLPLPRALPLLYCSKFLVDRSGKVVKRYGSTTAPLAIEADIKALL